jgi:hypothetical protein
LGGGLVPQILVIAIRIRAAEPEPIEFFLTATVSDSKIVATEKYSLSPGSIVLMCDCRALWDWMQLGRLLVQADLMEICGSHL